jgi:hypothetical protein
MYYIYKIAYLISDDIKAKKDAEKPFWWEHLHSDVKDKPIEEIEKALIEGGIAKDKLEKMSRHEKIMAMSEGCYAVECQKSDEIIAELEKNVERSKTSFINQPTNNLRRQQVLKQEVYEPIEFGKSVSSPSSIPSGNDMMSMPAVSSDDDFTMPSEMPKNDVSFDAIKNEKSDPFGGALKGENLGIGSAEIRRHAQSIVSKVVSDINTKSDQIPDDVSSKKEQELLQAVISELQTLK